MLLAAGLKGIEEGYELPPGAEDDVWALTEAERRALGSSRCRRSSAEAIAVMERSELVAETLGEHVFDFFLRNKRAEWEEYRRQVTQFELDRYLRCCERRRERAAGVASAMHVPWLDSSGRDGWTRA